MKVFKTDINNIKQSEKKSCVTIGMFDALHKYHKIIIKKTELIAREHNLESVIITFDHKPNKESQTLLDEKKKIEFLKENFKIDQLIILNVDESLIKTTRNEFVNILKSKLKTVKLVEGSDFKFGFQKSGDIQYLKKSFGEENVFVYQRNENISTSRIKELVKENKIDQIEDELEVNINLLK
ncbi:FAD synthetase [Mesoplasma coleopterae]|uniref:FAD synthase n=1 Tax=Mesoplasma coleopterae TaxID=324078 RepID=A0A2K8P5F6_9MOLU|nr:FAD synthetase [Mesoplasma coleopterae]ATZ20815.1 bifunctional riboflavin kinase/FMN adenylyltransferase [Mesoplasma coleopterae]AVN62320.1 FAD synthetase [Mesoplasma coleopterae]